MKESVNVLIATLKITLSLRIVKGQESYISHVLQALLSVINKRYRNAILLEIAKRNCINQWNLGGLR